MILNAPSILYAALAVLGLLLSLGILVTVHRTRNAPRPADRETGLVLALLMGQSLVLVRLASWPTLYWAMGSFIPLVPGAMCLYGVAQNPRALTLVLELAEPLGLLLVGATLLVLRAYREAPTGTEGPGARSVLGHLQVAAVVGLGVSALGLAYMLVDKNTQAVSCCSSAFGTDARLSLRLTAMLPGSISRFMLPVNQSLALALAAFHVFFVLRPKRALGGLLLILAGSHTALTLLNLFEVLAPVLNGMPGHHCAYCIANPSITPPFLTMITLVAFAAATFVPVWQVWAWTIGAVERPRMSAAGIAVIGLATFWGLLLVPYYRLMG